MAAIFRGDLIQEAHMEIFAAGSALLLMLAALKALAPKRIGFLPLGGSSISEIGIVLAFCLALFTLTGAF